MTTNDILKKARELGEDLAKHDAVTKLIDATKAFDDDRDAQRLLLDYSRAMQTVAQKQATHQPIEVAEKQQLEQLQQQLVTNLKLRSLQMAQMDYLDLMRSIDAALTPEALQDAAPTSGPDPAAPAGPSPLSMT